MLVDRTGLIIANVSKFSYFPIDIDEIGATASAIFAASEDQGANLKLGGLKLITSEFSEGKMFVASCGSKGVLSLISGPNVNLAWIRLILKRSAEELKKKLDRFFNGDNEYSEPSRKLRSTSTTPFVSFK